MGFLKDKLRELFKIGEKKEEKSLETDFSNFYYDRDTLNLNALPNIFEKKKK